MYLQCKRGACGGGWVVRVWEVWWGCLGGSVLDSLSRTVRVLLTATITAPLDYHTPRRGVIVRDSGSTLTVIFWPWECRGSAIGVE
jgi:hypothetical protein